MAITETLKTLLGAPVAAVLDATIRRMVDDILDRRALARAAELDAVKHQIATLATALQQRAATTDALEQAMAARGGPLLDDLDQMDPAEMGTLLDSISAGQERQAKDVRRLEGAMQATSDRMEALQKDLTDAVAAAAKAGQLATSALSTAESAADAVTELEHR